MNLIDYKMLQTAVALVVDAHVTTRTDGGRVYDYSEATASACNWLGCDPATALGNLVDGMIVDAVEERFGSALPDSRLTPETPAP